MKPQDIVTARKLSERLFDAYKKHGKESELEKVAFGRWVECDAYDHVKDISSTEYEYVGLGLGMGTIFFLEHKEYKVKKCFPALEFTGLWSLLPPEVKNMIKKPLTGYFDDNPIKHTKDYIQVLRKTREIIEKYWKDGLTTILAEILIYLAEKEMV